MTTARQLRKKSARLERKIIEAKKDDSDIDEDEIESLEERLEEVGRKIDQKMSRAQMEVRA